MNEYIKNMKPGDEIVIHRRLADKQPASLVTPKDKDFQNIELTAKHFLYWMINDCLLESVFADPEETIKEYIKHLKLNKKTIKLW